MDKKTQDLLWSVLTKEEREIIRDFIFTPTDKEFSRGCKKAYDSIFGDHNLTSATEPEELIYADRQKTRDFIVEMYELAKKSASEAELQAFQMAINFLEELFGDKCLPDTPNSSNLSNIGKDALEHRLEQTVQESVQVEPKPELKVGQSVRVLAERAFGRIEKIEEYDEDDDTYRLEYLPDFWFEPSELEPYTEESRNLSQNIANYDKSEDNQLKDNMEEKELNLNKLLKDCKGEKIFSTFEGDMTIVSVTDSKIILHGYNTDLVCGNGFYASGICQLWPSRELYEKYPLDPYSAWMEWKESRKPKRWKPSLGDEYFSISGCAKVIKLKHLDNSIDLELERIHNRFRTEEEAKQAAEAVRETLEKFYEKNCEE